MFRPNNPNQKPQEATMNDRLNGFYWLAKMLALFTLPITRMGFGLEAFGFAGFAAMGILWYAAVENYQRDIWVWRYFWLWLVAFILNRVYAFRVRAWTHSIYLGYPILMRFFSIREGMAKGMELILVLAAVGAVSHVSKVLAGLWGLSFCGLCVIRGLDFQVRVMTTRRFKDAVIEQGMYQRWRGGED